MIVRTCKIVRVQTMSAGTYFVKVTVIQRTPAAEFKAWRSLAAQARKRWADDYQHQQHRTDVAASEAEARAEAKCFASAGLI